MRLRTLAGLGLVVVATVGYRALEAAPADPFTIPSATRGMGELVARIGESRHATIARRAISELPNDAEPEPEPEPEPEAAGLTIDLPLEHGMIRGRVTDARSYASLVGAVVIASSPTYGSIAEITDEDGAYAMIGLPPGVYQVTFYYADRAQAHEVTIAGDRPTLIYASIDTDRSDPDPGDEAPTIDPESTVQGITIDHDYIKNIPVPGRTFEAVLGAAAGSQDD